MTNKNHRVGPLAAVARLFDLGDVAFDSAARQRQGQAYQEITRLPSAVTARKSDASRQNKQIQQLRGRLRRGRSNLTKPYRS
jgi:hypothetical protein